VTRSVVGVLGSPRHGKNTAVLVEKVLEGARSQGLQTSLHYVNNYHIYPCDGCDACKETHRCIIEDDMHIFYNALEKSDGLVLGTPIYFDHVTAQTKTFLDRLYCYLGPNLESSFPAEYRAVIVVTYGDSNEAWYEEVVEWLRDRLWGYWRIETVAAVKVANADNAPPSGRPELLERAYEAGVKLAESIG
jgi:multimeric flavodoxin WrbA